MTQCVTVCLIGTPDRVFVRVGPRVGSEHLSDSRMSSRSLLGVVLGADLAVVLVDSMASSFILTYLPPGARITNSRPASMIEVFSQGEGTAGLHGNGTSGDGATAAPRAAHRPHTTEGCAGGETARRTHRSYCAQEVV